MKRITVILFVLITCMNAQISNKQLQNYLKKSGELRAYSIYSSDIKYFLNTLNIQQGDFPEIDKMAVLILKSPELKKTYIETFKNMPKELYENIINFYETDIGQKYAETNRWIYDYSKIRKINMLKQDYKKAIDSGLLNGEKINIINKIVKEFNESQLISDATRKLYLFTNKIRNNTIEIPLLSSKLVDIKNKFAQILPYLFYQQLSDFSNNDLEHLSNYAKTEAGKYERKLIYRALINWLISIEKIAYKNQDKIFNMEFCYMNSSRMKNKPTICRPEWLKKTTDKNSSR